MPTTTTAATGTERTGARARRVADGSEPAKGRGATPTRSNWHSVSPSFTRVRTAVVTQCAPQRTG